MTINTNIIGGRNNKTAVDVISRNDDRGLVVYTEKLRLESDNTIYFSNEDFGVDMNQTSAFSGTPIKIHNGIDDVYWTGSNIIGGKATFNSTDRANTGSQSIRFDNPAVNDTWQLDKGSNQDLTSYTSVTMAINVDKDWDSEIIEFYGYNTGTGLEVGNRVSISDYFNEGSFDVWHIFSISLSDMGLEGETIDSFRFQLTNAGAGKKPKIYIDDIQIEETGSPIIFKAVPSPDTVFRASKIQLTFVDAFDSSITNGTMLGLSYDKLLGLSSLSSGVDLTIQQNNKTTISYNIKNIFDFIYNTFSIKDTICDGTNTLLTLEYIFIEPIILSYLHRDEITITINDDLTGLLKFKGVLRGTKEFI